MGSKRLAGRLKGPTTARLGLRAGFVGRLGSKASLGRMSGLARDGAGRLRGASSWWIGPPVGPAHLFLPSSSFLCFSSLAWQAGSLGRAGSVSGSPSSFLLFSPFLLHLAGELIRRGRAGARKQWRRGGPAPAKKGARARSGLSGSAWRGQG